MLYGLCEHVKMKLDLDPDKNRQQYNKIRNFTANYNVMFRPWFYYVLGSGSIIFGLVAIFSETGLIENTGSIYSQAETGLILLGFGTLIVGCCKLLSLISLRIGQYKPRKNRGDEWDR